MGNDDRRILSYRRFSKADRPKIKWELLSIACGIFFPFAFLLMPPPLSREFAWTFTFAGIGFGIWGLPEKAAAWKLAVLGIVLSILAPLLMYLIGLAMLGASFQGMPH